MILEHFYFTIFSLWFLNTFTSQVSFFFDSLCDVWLVMCISEQKLYLDKKQPITWQRKSARRPYRNTDLSFRYAQATWTAAHWRNRRGLTVPGPRPGLPAPRHSWRRSGSETRLARSPSASTRCSKALAGPISVGLRKGDKLKRLSLYARWRATKQSWTD